MGLIVNVVLLLWGIFCTRLTWRVWAGLFALAGFFTSTGFWLRIAQPDQYYNQMPSGLTALAQTFLLNLAIDFAVFAFFFFFGFVAARFWQYSRRSRNN